ncbi:MAG TPA: gliding motility-associated C-terminal domain-containing protein [Puia sp.]|nr:gliding motility-associated C-terminal domain-containing protein [Puia sp.]
MKKGLITGWIVTCLSLCCFAQTDREFWFAVPNVDGNGGNYNLPIVVRMTSFSTPATVTISVPANPSFSPITLSLPANSTQTVDLSTWVDILQTTPNAVQNKGLFIQSTAYITAYYEVVSSYCSCNPEIFSLKGRNALGTLFYISSQYTYSIDTVRQPAATTSFDVVATQDNTIVTVTPSQPIVGHGARVSLTVALNRGQTWSAAGIYRDLNHHLQGSIVQSDKPVAVTLKDDLVWGDGTCADLIGDQTIPVSMTGSDYIVSKGYLSPRDRVFILATEDNTSIYLDGSATPSALLNKGKSWTFNLSDNSAYIRGDKNFYVYHVTGNGCELGSAIIPRLTCAGSAAVSVVRSSDDRFGVMLITKNGLQGSFSVNGNTGVVKGGDFAPVPGTGGAYVAATIDLSDYLPAGSVFNFSNPVGKFSMGFLNGNKGDGCRYGFFSDFSEVSIGPDTAICPGGEARLFATGAVVYSWSPAQYLDDPGSARPLAHVGTKTEFYLNSVDSNNCKQTDSVAVSIRPAPAFQPPPDETMCQGLNVTLASPNGPGYIYQWSPADRLDHSSAPYPVANPSVTTSYTLHITDSTCTGYDSTFTMKVTVRPDVFVVPNAFTPNGDGHNDCFGIRQWGNSKIEQLDVYDRWGQRVFSTHNPSECWDGTFHGRPQPAGAYAYSIRAHTFCGEVTRTGVVMLIR